MKRSLGLVAAGAAGCLVLAAILRPIAPLSARVEGGAMSPTLNDQDRLIVNRSAYRLSSPRRGHLVMLRYPADQRRSFVKRIIAQGGDSVRIEDGRVYLNDQPSMNATSRRTLAVMTTFRDRSSRPDTTS